MKHFAIITAVTFSLLIAAACVEGGWNHLGINIKCGADNESLCPERDEVRAALDKMYNMWSNISETCGTTPKWPVDHKVRFYDRKLPFDAHGLYIPNTGEIQIRVNEDNQPAWEPILDHEIGMAVLGAVGVRESEFIELRKCMAACYQGGDEGYCADKEEQ